MMIMMNVNNRRSQSVNSNNNSNLWSGQNNNLNGKTNGNSKQLSIPSSQLTRDKIKSQFKLIQFKLNIEDIKTIQSCYECREDSIFQMRVCAMQILENISSKTQNEIIYTLRQISMILQETERFRVDEENIILNVYNSPLVQPILLESNSNAKQMIFKLGSKINKINNSYFQKLQFYFPKMAELIQQDQCAWNSSFKESLSQQMSTNGLFSTQSGGQSQQINNHSTSQLINSTNQTGVQVVTVLQHILNKSRNRFQKELSKLQNYLQTYSGMIEKSTGFGKASEKNNKNEKLYLDKYIQGESAFAYTKHIMTKYLIRSSHQSFHKLNQQAKLLVNQTHSNNNRTNNANNNNTKQQNNKNNTENDQNNIINENNVNKNTNTINYSNQIVFTMKSLYKNPYDILQLEDKKIDNKSLIMQGTGNQNQNGGSVSSSCASTSKTSSTSESVWEIIVTNYDKNIKEMMSQNKYINTQIKIYIECFQKWKESQQISSKGNNIKNSIILNKNIQQQLQQSSQNEIQQKFQNLQSSKPTTTTTTPSTTTNIQNQIKTQNLYSTQNQYSKQNQIISDQSNNQIYSGDIIKSCIKLDLNQQDRDLPYTYTKTESNILSKCKTYQGSILQSEGQCLNQNSYGNLSQRYNQQQQSYSGLQPLSEQSNLKGQKSQQSSLCNTSNNIIYSLPISESNKDQSQQQFQRNYDNSSFYVINNNVYNNSNDLKIKEREKSLTLNCAGENSINTVKDNNSIGEFQYVRRMKSDDSKNLIMRTSEYEDNSFQQSENPYRILRYPHKGLQNKIWNKTIEIENQLQKEQLLMNEGNKGEKINEGVVQSSKGNISNKQLHRVIISPFQNEFLTNNLKKSSVLFIKQNGGNNIQNNLNKQPQSNINLNTTNPFNPLTQPNVYQSNNNFHYQNIINNNNSSSSTNTNLSNSLSHSTKHNLIKFSVSSISKQIDLPYIEQFNQIFESKKRNVFSICESYNKNGQGMQQQINKQLQQIPSNKILLNQNSTFTQGTVITQTNDEITNDELTLKESNPLLQKPKQYKSFTITSREGNNLIQNGLNLENSNNTHNHIISASNSISNLQPILLGGVSSPVNQQQNDNQQIIQIGSQNIMTSNSIHSSRQISNTNQKNEINSSGTSFVNIGNLNCISNNTTGYNSYSSNTINNININNNNNNYNINNVFMKKGQLNQIKNNINTPNLKSSVQLKMSHKVYSGPIFNCQIINNSKNKVNTPKKYQNQLSKKKRLSTPTSSTSGNNFTESQAQNTKNTDISQMTPFPSQMQKFCNLNLEQNNTYSSAYFDQQPQTYGIDQSQKILKTPQIGKNQANSTADNFLLTKQQQQQQQQQNNQKIQNELQSLNTSGQFINLNQNNSQQPVLSRITNPTQGSFSPLKLDTLEQRKQKSGNNNNNNNGNLNVQISILKKNENIRRKSINSAYSSSGQDKQQQQQIQDNIFSKQSIPNPVLNNINGQKKSNSITFSNSNQFVIKKNSSKKNYDNSQSTATITPIMIGNKISA